MWQAQGKEQKSIIRFSDGESDFLSENFLGRLATVSQTMQPHVVPVAYAFDGANLYLSGRNLASTLKFKQMMANNRVAFVVDDLMSSIPLIPRGVEIRGVAEPLKCGDGLAVKIVPTRKKSWGLE